MTRYKQLCRDVRDSQHENLKEKEELTDNIRIQERELDFLSQILNVALSKEELDAIKSHSVWDEEKEDWILPNFEFNEGRAAPPKNRDALNPAPDRNSAAVSPQPLHKDAARDGKNFRVKHGGGASKDANPFRASNANRFEQLQDEIFDGSRPRRPATRMP